MPSPGHGKHRKGAPLAGLSATSKGDARTVNWRVQRTDHAAFHALAEAHGVSASEFAREVADAAARATGNADPVTDERTFLSARLSHDQIAQLSAAAGASELEPTVWLRLMTTGAGDVLLRQLQAARKLARKR